MRRILVALILILAGTMTFLAVALAFPYDAVPPRYVACDLNHDGEVDTSDVLIAAASFGTSKGMPAWYAAADVDRDGFVGIADIFFVCTAASL